MVYMVLNCILASYSPFYCDLTPLTIELCIFETAIVVVRIFFRELNKRDFIFVATVYDNLNSYLQKQF